MHEPGMHSHASQMGWYEDGVREHHATEVGRIVARYFADTTNFERGNARVRGEMAATERAGRRGMRSWAQAGKYVALGVGAAVVGSLKSFADYQRNLQIFQANTDASAKTMVRASDKAKKLGADLRFPGVTAGDAAEALVELSKAGLKPNAAIDALSSTLLLGTAGQMDYASAAAIAANAMNAFHKNAKQLPAVVDDIAGAALKSSSDVNDVAEAFRYTSTSAEKLGVPIDMVTTLVGLLSNVGLKGDMAGTSLRMFFTSLAKPRSNAAADMMREAGLLIGGKHGNRKGQNLFFDEKGNIKSMDKIAQLYKTHVADKMTKQQRLAFDNTVLGVRGQNLTAIFNQGAAGIRKFHRESTKAGAANKLAQANTKGLYGAYQALLNTVQTLGLELGEQLAPTVIRILHHLNGLAGVMQRNKGFVKALAAAITAIVAGYLAWRAALIVWGVAQAIHNTLVFIGKGIMIAYRTAIVAIRAPMALATVAQEGFNAAVSANPLGLIILAIIAVILILRHFGVSMDDVIRIARKTWHKMKEYFNKVREVIGNVIEWIKKHWALVIMGMVAAPALAVILIIRHFHQIVKFLKEKLGPLMLKAIKAAFRFLLDGIVKLAKWFYEAGKELGKRLGDGIKDAAIDAAKGIGESILDDIKHPGRAVGNSIGVRLGKAVWHQAGDLSNGPGPNRPSGRSSIHGGHRAMGGSVWAGTSYTVGENGPEEFVPGVSGSIRPHGGAAPTVNIENMNVASEEDPYVIASVLSRRMAFAQ